MSDNRGATWKQPGRISSNVTPFVSISSGEYPAAAISRFTEYVWSS
jgi:hypothetical protein